MSDIGEMRGQMTRADIARIRALVGALKHESVQRFISHTLTAHDIRILLDAATSHADGVAARLDLADYTANSQLMRAAIINSPKSRARKKG